MRRLADIPIIHLGYHGKKYGKFAIGFHRSAAIRSNFNSVLYCLNNSNVVQSLYAGLHRLGDTGELTIDDDKALHMFEVTQAQYLRMIDPEPAPKSKPSLSSLSESLEHLGKSINARNEEKHRAVNTLKRTIAYVKTFDHDEFDSIYTEREWRSTKPFSFGFADVPMIVVPRSGGFFDRLIAEADNLGLPRSVSIVAWEELVEH